MNWLLETLDVQELTTRAVSSLPRIGAAILVFLVFWGLFRVTRAPLGALLRRSGLHEKLVELVVGSIYRYVLLIMGLVMAADQMGINVAAALAGLGVAGIAVGFAAQDSLANIIAGFTIFMDKPFVVGDFITTEGQYGTVSNITLRTTRIRTPRNSWVILPNKTIIDSILENHSKNGELRVEVPVGIAYKEDIPTARTVLLAAVQGLPEVLDAPEPDVVVSGLGGSSVDLMVRVWISNAQSERGVEAGVVEACKLALDAANIEIPFPHLQLFVENVEDRVWDRAARLTGKPTG